MKKIISFSLYGTDPKYTHGAICNAELGKIIFPEWICRFYCGTSVPQNIVDELRTYENVEVIIMEEDNKRSYMTWRFLAIDDDDVEIMLSRDADSRLSFRERKLVDMFVESDKVFHDVRDHGLHMHTMGGTWGMKKGAIKSMKELMDSKDIGMGYAQDQLFMYDTVSPMLTDKILLHNSEFNPERRKCREDFPIQMDEILSPLAQPVHIHFIGEIFPYDNFGKPKNHIFY
jgi:hypothetical protein